MRKRIWFNHWFSTAYRIIELIRGDKGNTKYTIVGTSSNKDMVYKKVCDEFYVEPEYENGRDYVEWCLKFCTEYRIDVFIPKRHMVAISERVSDFEKIGVKVLVHKDSGIIHTLNNKYETAKLFSKHNICEVPQIEIATNVNEFIEGYKKIKGLIGENDRVCIKYSEGEGATSFRVIDERVESIETLDKGIGKKMSYSQVVNMLGEVESFKELMIMPYLKGIEISVDSLMTSKGFIGVIRRKLGSRITKVDIEGKALEISKKFAEITGITCPYNLQLRYHKETLYLLEVNTRMAGGVHLGSLSGINIPKLAVRDLLGEEIEIPKEIQNIKVTQIETPILLNND